MQVSKKNLLGVLSTAYRAIPSKASLPITEGFLFKAEDGVLTVTATDTNLTISASTDCIGDTIGVIPAKTLLEIVKTLPDGGVEIEVSGNVTHITWGSGHSDIPAYSADDFPVIAVPTENAETIECESASLRSALQHTIPCCGDDPIRPVPNGVFFNTASPLDLAASDTHILSAYKIGGNSISESFIVPISAASVIKDALLDDENIAIKYENGSIFFCLDGFTLMVKGIVGKFLNYASIFPQGNGNVLTADKDEFLRAIRRVSVCASKASKASNTIKFILTQLGGCAIEAQDLGFSVAAHEDVDCITYTGEDLTIGLKTDLLQKLVSALDCEKVTLSFSDAKHAVMVEGEGDVCRSIIMPVAIC